MKKFLTLIFLFLFIFSAQAAEKTLVIEDLRETAEPEYPTFEQKLNRIISELQHFDTQYPDNAIYTDFSADVASRFPELSSQEVMDYENYIRKTLGIYRWGKNLYQSYKEKLLAPETPPLILDDSEYDLLSPEPEYIASDSPVIIEDFKKVISYSSDPKDTKSYIAKLSYNARHGNDRSDWEEFADLANVIDWRHIFYYDIYYHSPITGSKGIGDWTGDADSLRARILTIETGTAEKTNIRGAIHLLTAPQHFVIATNNQRGRAPQIRFSADNLQNIRYNLPVPERFLFPDDPWQDLAIYSGESSIPFTADITDLTKPVQISAELDFWLCDQKLQCRPLQLTPQLQLKVIKARESSVSTYVRQLHNLQTRSTSGQLSVIAAGTEKLGDQGEILKIELKSRKKIDFFDVFINSPDNILLQRPRITIDGKNITVRVLPVDAAQKLADKDFEIIANLNGHYTLRQQYHFAARNSRPAGNRLSLHLIWLALLGGFILNFMPCVFPVLSLKLFSLTRFGARRPAAIRRNFAYTMLGLFGGFALLATILAFIKALGISIGWGMQFQSPIFLVLIFLAIVIFILQIGGLIEIRLPAKLQNAAATEQNDNLLHFLTGTMIVLMATPCTAPYLSTVIGFALTGSIGDIFAIMAAVATGLALPYILLYAFPALIIFMPAPGPWMEKLNRFMQIMLWLTLIWLFSVIWAQTGWGFALRFALYALLFAACFALIRLNCEDAENAEDEQLGYIVNKFLLVVALLLAVVAVADARFAGKNRLQELRRQTVPTIEQAEISHLLQQGKTVLVTVGADWCLTCRYNNAMVFKNPSFERNITDKGVAVINIDWTNYDSSTLQFMEKYGRSSLPFYIIFSPLLPEGMVLPELLNERDLNRLINNITLYRPPA